ncbi:MAG: anaerobic glycerol-3-phosphate dehydrogenase subunit A [Ardenticatenia bacterium]|nr:MAG: anaerobic glycerol-3-phosphate dehydrogenase subunit A [Ardenticatenia bacterium]
MRRVETEVLVIGGGAIGAGVARDLAMRGLKAILVERADWASGTTGRYNGLLHSGSRYALRDIRVARECIQENIILRKIMPGCIEDTGGYVVATPWDDPVFGDYLIKCCNQAGIPIEEVSVGQVLREEPYVHPDIRRALRVPDAAADSFVATRATVHSAREYGAYTWNYHPVVKVLKRNGCVTGAECLNLCMGDKVRISAHLVINAAGAWVGEICALAGIKIPIVCSKGSMIATACRVVNTVITRLHWPSDCDSVLPSHSVSVLGCTDVIVNSPDALSADAEEVQRIRQECAKLVPITRGLRWLRTWTGVRALYPTTPIAEATAVGLSRTHVIVDHAVADGVPGLISIVGGKWTTHRLIAEQVGDLVCHKLNVVHPCRTHLEPLPGLSERCYHWHSAPLARIETKKMGGDLVCECEMVTRTEIEKTLAGEDVRNLDDLRRATRLGMGPCQGGFCSYRAAGTYHRLRSQNARDATAHLLAFLQERWRGIRPVASGHQVHQMRLNEMIHRNLLGAEQLTRMQGGDGVQSLADMRGVVPRWNALTCGIRH